MARLRLAESYLKGRESAQRGFLEMRRYQTQKANLEQQRELAERRIGLQEATQMQQVQQAERRFGLQEARQQWEVGQAERQYGRQQQLDIQGRQKFELGQEISQQKLEGARAKFEQEGTIDALQSLYHGVDPEEIKLNYNRRGEDRLRRISYDQERDIATISTDEGTHRLRVKPLLTSLGKLERPKPGVDIPFIEDVESQKIRMGVAKRKVISPLQQRKLELEVGETERKLAAEERERQANLETGRASIDNMLNSVVRAMATPDEVIEDATGPISVMTPTIQQSTADFEELINTLSSQAFLAQIPAMKGMGALSDAEGQKLQTSLQNLSLRQSPKRLKENFTEIHRLMNKARKNLAQKAGVPETRPDIPVQNRNITVDY